MPKKCIICDLKASHVIRDTNDYYCQDCAEDNFSDIDMLEKLQEVISQNEKKGNSSDWEQKIQL